MRGTYRGGSSIRLPNPLGAAWNQRSSGAITRQRHGDSRRYALILMCGWCASRGSDTAPKHVKDVRSREPILVADLDWRGLPLDGTASNVCRSYEQTLAGIS